MSEPAAVRRLEARDLPRLPEIEAAADTIFPFAADPAWPAPASAMARMRERGFMLVIGEPVAVGFVHCLDLGDGLWHLEQISVDPAHARRGHGRALLRAAQQLAAHHGGTKLTLTTYADIAFNAPFYASEGFVEQQVGDLPARVAQILRAEEESGLLRWGRRVTMGRSIGGGCGSPER